ncbi:hypothetical protein FN846DRAFT_887539 [Sphaerosporella brunnea]|uniref:Structure-specific endonuclease subunit SLX4 n=1 Tax=Sphaerosporella brunnea TaxID=1250544 RepID=A0A5J5F6I0_9PEZI|nr:hypothetical protein FN846DRAFT_887539 [Sphaerosporella brunnea]
MATLIPSSPLHSQLSILSSSQLPSPRTLIREISTAQAGAKAKQAAALKPDIWEIPDSQDEEERLPPAPKAKKAATKKRAAPGTTTKITAARKTKPKADVALKAKSTNRDVRLGLKSKYFVDSGDIQEPEKAKPVRKTATRKKTAASATATAAKSTKKKASPKGKSKAFAETETSKAVSPTVEDLLRSSPPPGRRQWTPVEDTITTAFDLQSGEASAELTPETDNFSNKIGALAYRSESSQDRELLTSAQPESGFGLGFTRKRRIEMLDLTNHKTQPKEFAPKAKKPKKRPATLTERSSAFYRKDAPPSSAITSFFSSTKKTTSDSSKYPTLDSATTKRKRNDEAVRVELLSPTSAKKRLDSQGFFFGTLSQLEKDLHDSEDEYSGLISPVKSVDTGPNTAGFNSITSRATVTGGLWDAANRDLDGGLLRGTGNGDVLDTESYQPATIPKLVLPSSLDLPKSEDDFYDIGSVLSTKLPSPKRTVIIDLTSSPAVHVRASQPLDRTQSPPLPSSFRRANSIQRIAPRSISPSLPPRPSISADSSLAAATARSLTTSSATAAAKKRQTVSLASPPPAPASRTTQTTSDIPKMPDFGGYLKSELQSELKKYGFKKITSRAAMITTMEKCWLAQNPSAQKPQGSSEDSEPEPAKRPRGRPRKTASMESDGTAEQTTTGPRARSTSKEPKKTTSKAVEPRGRPASKGSDDAPHATEARARSASKDRDVVANPRGRAASKALDDTLQPVHAKSRSRSASKDPDVASREKTKSRGRAASPKVRKGKKSRSRSSSRGRKKQVTRVKKTGRDESETTELYAKISEAVRVNGKSKDSFHHCILMYDPVILEDLTIWLNTKGLGTVGIDEEVSLDDVRGWCDANGVCALARQTQRGLERKRY